MSHGSSNSCGVAILFKKGFYCTVLSKFHPLGRYLILKAEIKDKLYVLINIHRRTGRGGEGGCSPPKVWATQIFWAARENLGKASF